MFSRPKEDIKIVLLWPKGAFYLIGGAWRLTSSAPIKDHQTEPNFWTVFQGPKKKRQENDSRLWCLKKCQECGFLDAALPYPDAHRLHFPRSPPSSLFPNARRLHFSQMLTTFTFLRCLPSSLFFLKRLKGMSALINGRL